MSWSCNAEPCLRQAELQGALPAFTTTHTTGEGFGSPVHITGVTSHGLSSFSRSWSILTETVSVKFPSAAEPASLLGSDLQQRGSWRQVGLVLKEEMATEPQ